MWGGNKISVRALSRFGSSLKIFLAVYFAGLTSRAVAPVAQIQAWILQPDDHQAQEPTTDSDHVLAGMSCLD